MCLLLEILEASLIGLFVGIALKQTLLKVTLKEQISDPPPPDRFLPRVCAIKQHTADGAPAGRCFYYVGETGRCPLHGDVRMVQKRFIETGKLTNDFELE